MGALVSRRECEALADMLRARGYRVTPPATADEGDPPPDAYAPLTRRQLEVLLMVRRHRGCVKSAAFALGIGYETAKGHLRNIYERRGAETMADAFCWGCGRGLIPPGGPGHSTDGKV